MKIVSWNCNGGFRKKYKELFNAYYDADLFMVQECENPDFYNSREYKSLFQNGFHVGTPDYSMKGIGVFAPFGRTRIFPWQVHTDPHDSINKGVNTYPYILQTL